MSTGPFTKINSNTKFLYRNFPHFRRFILLFLSLFIKSYSAQHVQAALSKYCYKTEKSTSEKFLFHIDKKNWVAFDWKLSCVTFKKDQIYPFKDFGEIQSIKKILKILSYFWSASQPQCDLTA